MLGMLMMKSNFNKEFLLVNMVVLFYLKPKKDEISFWIEFIFVLNGFDRGVMCFELLMADFGLAFFI